MLIRFYQFYIFTPSLRVKGKPLKEPFLIVIKFKIVSQEKTFCKLWFKNQSQPILSEVSGRKKEMFAICYYESCTMKYETFFDFN